MSHILTAARRSSARCGAAGRPCRPTRLPTTSSPGSGTPLHTIECRELGTDAAKQRFGPFADTYPGHVFLRVHPDHLRARYPDHAELHGLLEAVRDRGPAVAVTLATAAA